ncbi:hypothetical protein CERSUDRAFT_90040 [Gelatoporia subvermispora B]|uniref:Uncharacterized protein n=1 Tax=Ceriporiopsis subvermispora (strain B) TaxID=914234 RepID=M2QWK5_CERS8|nr:hypothetical protein CERSUDRAFT_90040 [Gelatoporia subvermispora B]
MRNIQSTWTARPAPTCVHTPDAPSRRSAVVLVLHPILHKRYGTGLMGSRRGHAGLCAKLAVALSERQDGASATPGAVGSGRIRREGSVHHRAAGYFLLGWVVVLGPNASGAQVAPGFPRAHSALRPTRRQPGYAPGELTTAERDGGGRRIQYLYVATREAGVRARCAALRCATSNQQLTALALRLVLWRTNCTGRALPGAHGSGHGRTSGAVKTK